MRLRKNSLGVYRLDHDSGGHDDQAIALALGVHWLLEADGSAEAERLAEAGKPRQLSAAGSRTARGQAASDPATATAASGEPLEGIVLDAVTARKRARDEAYRAQHGYQFGRFAAGGR